MDDVILIDGVVSGNINTTHIVNGSIASSSLVSGSITVGGSSAISIYDGSYEVTPLTDTEQVLETYGKRMEDDVVVLAIPYYETTNESGGYTVNIG